MKINQTALIFLFTAFTLFGCDDRPDYSAYETWDADRDDALTEEEFSTVYTDVDYYGTWDVDNDGFIDENEWQTGIGTYYPAYNYDVNGYYDAWDLNDDNRLDADEFVSGNFTLWDTNRDGKVEMVEYEEWYYDIEGK